MSHKSMCSTPARLRFASNSHSRCRGWNARHGAWGLIGCSDQMVPVWRPAARLIQHDPRLQLHSRSSHPPGTACLARQLASVLSNIPLMGSTHAVRVTVEHVPARQTSFADVAVFTWHSRSRVGLDCSVGGVRILTSVSAKRCPVVRHLGGQDANTHECGPRHRCSSA